MKNTVFIKYLNSASLADIYLCPKPKEGCQEQSIALMCEEIKGFCLKAMLC